MIYRDGQEVRNGDTWRTYANEQYTYTAIDEGFRFVWRCIQVPTSYGTMEPSACSNAYILIRRKESPKSGFGKFIRRVEGSNAKV
jgi:hypothetical protein